MQFDRLYTVPVGHKFHIVAVDKVTGEWFQVEPMPDATAWIMSDYVRMSGAVPESTTAIAAVAQPEAATSVTTPAAPSEGESPWALPPSVSTESTGAASGDAYSEQMAQAEQLYKTETSKQNPAEWDLDTLRGLYGDIATNAANPLLKSRANIRLAQLRAYQVAKDRWSEMGKVDEDLQKQLADLEKQRQEEITAAAAAAPDEAGYLARGTIEKFFITSIGGATHKIMDGERILYLLKSDVVDLTALEGKYAGIKGSFLEVPGQNVRVIEVGSAVVLTK